MSVYLAYVHGPRGPEPQLWYKDGNRFVVPSEVQPLAPPRLVPDYCSNALDKAISWHHRNPVKEAA